MVEPLVEEVVDVGGSALLVHHVGRDESVGLEVSCLFVRLVLGMLRRPCTNDGIISNTLVPVITYQ